MGVRSGVWQCGGLRVRCSKKTGAVGFIWRATTVMALPHPTTQHRAQPATHPPNQRGPHQVARVALDLGAHPLPAQAALQLPALLLDAADAIYGLHPAVGWSVSVVGQVGGWVCKLGMLAVGQGGGLAACVHACKQQASNIEPAAQQLPPRAAAAQEHRSRPSLTSEGPRTSPPVSTACMQRGTTCRGWWWASGRRPPPGTGSTGGLGRSAPSTHKTFGFGVDVGFRLGRVDVLRG